MRIQITYTYQTYSGHTKTNWAIAHTYKEAEEICKAAEGLGCRIVDVTREE